MVPSEKGALRKGGLPNWLVFSVLGLAAMAGGLFLPRHFDSGKGSEKALTVPPAAAKDPLEYNPPALPELPSAGALLLRLGLGTTVVLLLCVLTLWAGKRWIRPLGAAQGENSQLRVVETLLLGGRCAVHLLQVGEAKVLAGVDGTGLKALLPLPQSFDGTLAELGTVADEEGAARLPGQRGPEAA